MTIETKSLQIQRSPEGWTKVSRIDRTTGERVGQCFAQDVANSTNCFAPEYVIRNLDRGRPQNVGRYAYVPLMEVTR